MRNECPFCKVKDKFKSHIACEMMFGLRDEFEYHECDDCGSLWLAAEISAEEMGKYYGPDYYSFEHLQDGRLKRMLYDWRDRAELGWFAPVGRLLAARKPNSLMRIIGTLNLPRSARILDVGCGGGRLLDRLKALGFTRLSGVDPYITENQTSADGVPITKAHLADLDGAFDLIMFHHSLEHMPQPIDELIVARAHLAPGGRCLVRLPTVSSKAWEDYGVNWVQLDAPRHTAIPSRHGFARAAELAGLKVVASIDDSFPFQFEGSERYRANVTLFDPAFAISPADHRRYQQESDALNAIGRGDQVAFVLTV